MNTLTKSLFAMTCLLFISGISFAGDRHHRSNSGISLGYSYSSGGHQRLQLGYSKHRNRHHNKYSLSPSYSQKSYSNNHNRSYHYSAPSYSNKPYSNHRDYRYNNYNYSHHNDRNHVYQKSCHPVTKSVVTNGYSHKIGGTMCYDSYGQGYIVSGSRYHKR